MHKYNNTKVIEATNECIVLWYIQTDYTFDTIAQFHDVMIWLQPKDWLCSFSMTSAFWECVPFTKISHLLWVVHRVVLTADLFVLIWKYDRSSISTEEVVQLRRDTPCHPSTWSKKWGVQEVFVRPWVVPTVRCTTLFLLVKTTRYGRISVPAKKLTPQFVRPRVLRWTCW